MDIIRDTSGVFGAPVTQLLLTHSELTGQPTEFNSRSELEAKTTMAILSAQNRDGHTGVPSGTDPVARTVEEQAAKCEAKGVAVPLPPEVATTGEVCPYPPNSLRARLWGEMQLPRDKKARAEAIAKRDEAEAQKEGAPPVKRKSPGASVTSLWYEATFEGTSTVQATSTRGEVLRFIQAVCKSRAESGFPAVVSLEEIEKHIQIPAKGFVHKLLEKNHIRCVVAPDLSKLIAKSTNPPPKSLQ